MQNNIKIFFSGKMIKDDRPVTIKFVSNTKKTESEREFEMFDIWAHIIIRMRKDLVFRTSTIVIVGITIQ